MPDGDQHGLMESLILRNMVLQKDRLNLAGISKDDAVLFLKDAEIDASDIKSTILLNSTEKQSTSIGNAAYLALNFDNPNQSAETPARGATTDSAVPDVFAKGSLFQFDSINADASSQQATDIEQEAEFMGSEPDEEQAKRLLEVEQECKDSYMRTYRTELINATASDKKPATQKRKLKRRRKQEQPVATTPAVLPSPLPPVVRKRQKAQGSRKNESSAGDLKKQAMLDLTSQPVDLDLSISTSASNSGPEVDLFQNHEIPMSNVEQEHVVHRNRRKPDAPKLATRPDSSVDVSGSIIVHKANAIEREEPDTKVYSVHPIANKRQDSVADLGIQQQRARKAHSFSEEDAEVKQLRDFSIVHPPARIIEAVAEKDTPVAPEPTPAKINMNAPVTSVKDAADKPHELNADTSPINISKSIHLQESPHESIQVIEAANLWRSRRRLRRSTSAIDQAIQRGISIVNDGMESTQLFNIVTNSREHTSDPSRFPISTSPKAVSTTIHSSELSQAQGQAQALDATLTLTALQPVKQIVLTPPQPSSPTKSQQYLPEIGTESRESYPALPDTPTLTELTDYMDKSLMSKTLSDVSGAQPTEAAEPTRKKSKKVSVSQLTNSAVQSYFKMALYDETYGSYKLRAFLTSGTGLTLEEIRQRYGVPVMNNKKVRDIKLETVRVNHTLLPRDPHTQRVILPELNKAIGEDVVYSYPSGGDPYITGIKVAFIPNKPPRPTRRQKNTEQRAEPDDSDKFIKRQTNRILRTLQRNELTVNRGRFQYQSKMGIQSADVFTMFSDLTFEYLYGIQIAKIVDERQDSPGKRAQSPSGQLASVMLWHINNASQSERITSVGLSITQLSSGWAKFFLYNNMAPKSGDKCEYTICQYESITIPRGVKFYLSSSPNAECYLLCCLINT